MSREIREQLYTMILAADSIAQMQPPSIPFCQALAQVTELLDEMSQDWYTNDAGVVPFADMTCEQIVQAQLTESIAA